MVNSSTTSITPATHAARHSIGGADPLVDPLLLHAARHDIGGVDEIPNLAAHAARHEAGGADEVNPAIFSTQTDVTASRNVAGTIYRNTSGKTMLVSVVLSLPFNATYACQAYAEDATPPTVLVAEFRENVIVNSHVTITFLVRDDDYYMVDGTIEANNCALTSWIEWT
jgi:hypothetical protein